MPVQILATVNWQTDKGQVVEFGWSGEFGSEYVGGKYLRRFS